MKNFLRGKWFFYVPLAIIIGLTITVTLIKCSSPIKIVDYNPDRDYSAIKSSFSADNYWLIQEGLDFDLDYALKTHSPNKYSSFYGKLNIKVLLDKGKFSGWITYYKRSYHGGWIQFLWIPRDSRRKGFGKKLVNYAIKDLFNKGCSEVGITTRTNNISAQRTYTSLGFKETSRDDGFVNYVFTRQ